MEITFTVLEDGEPVCWQSLGTWNSVLSAGEIPLDPIAELQTYHFITVTSLNHKQPAELASRIGCQLHEDNSTT